MRIVQWHGWLLEGSGSNIYASRVTEQFRRDGHEVLLLCQERHPDRYAFVDTVGSVSERGVSGLTDTGVPPGAGHVTLVRPDIGRLLPVFVLDEYEGFDVKRFVELSDAELDAYLARNVEALRAAVEWHGADAVITGHAVPGAVIGRRAVGADAYIAKIHGSDLEYAIRIDERYRELAREGLAGARAVIGTSEDVLERAFDVVPEARDRGWLVAPGVDPAFVPMPRRDALERTAAALERDPDTVRGRPTELDTRVRDALAARDAGTMDELARTYDQEVPDPDAGERLRSLAEGEGPLVGYLGKLIPQKGVHLLVQALCLAPQGIRCLVIGFGGFREWLHALVAALGAGDARGVRWIGERAGIDVELTDEEVSGAAGLAARVTFTGRLDHRYAPGALAALDALVVPSVLDEAFGMVSVEGAAAGAAPLVARHSGLAEIAVTLERAIPDGGPFSFEPGPGSVRRIAEAIERQTSRPAADRIRIRDALHRHAAAEWSWEHTARLLLEAAQVDLPQAASGPRDGRSLPDSSG
jgi:glycosyltransferase involved in cell wall biosynthesis